MNDELQQLRKEIDDLDQTLLEILAKRMAVVKKIGRYKKLHNIAIVDEIRWQKVLNTTLTKAKHLKLPEDFIKILYDLIHKQSVKTESEDK